MAHMDHLLWGVVWILSRKRLVEHFVMKNGILCILSQIQILPLSTYDHNPMLVDTYKVNIYKKYMFRFENIWLAHDQILDVVKQA